MERATVSVIINPGCLDMKLLIAYTGLCETTIRALLENDKDFPRPRKLSPKRVAYITKEVDTWLSSRPVSDLLPPSNTAKGGRARKNHE